MHGLDVTRRGHAVLTPAVVNRLIANGLSPGSRQRTSRERPGPQRAPGSYPSRARILRAPIQIFGQNPMVSMPG